MAIAYEKIVADDLNLGRGTVSVTMPAGGTATGAKIGIHTFLGDAIYNVKDYGALGDGLTVDKTAIQTAINAANAAGGGVVFFPYGTYLIDAALTLQPNVVLRGLSRFGSTIKIKSGTNWTAAAMLDSGTSVCTNIGLEDLGIDGNKSNLATITDGIGVFFGYVQRGFIRNCYITNTVRSGIIIGNSNAAGPAEDILIDGNLLSSCGKSDSASDCMGISGVNFQRVTVTGNHVINAAGTGIEFEKNPLPDVDTIVNLIISSNIVQANSGKFIHCGISVLGQPGDVAQSVVIANNIVFGDGVNAKVLCYLEYVDNFIVEGNVFRDSLTHGMQLVVCTRGVIRGNSLTLLSQATTNTSDGINADSSCDEILIHANYISGVGSSKKPRYAINYAGTNCQMLGNWLKDYVTGAINGSGSHVTHVHSGGDYVDENGGTVTGLDTASTGIKTQTVNHGLSGTPSQVVFTLQNPTDTSFRASAPWISSIGATQFTVNVPITTAGAAASTVDGRWRAWI